MVCVKHEEMHSSQPPRLSRAYRNDYGDDDAADAATAAEENEEVQKIETPIDILQKQLKKYCLENLQKFMEETTLHALKFVGNVLLSIWER